MTKELSKEILKKLEDFCESVKTALEVTEPEKKCKSFEDVKFCATDKPDKILIVFRGDEKVTEIINDGPKRYIKIEGGINATIKQIGPLYSIDDKRVNASNYDTINRLVKEYEAKFDKNRGGYDCERGHVNSEEKKDEVVLYRGRKIYDILDNSYILGDFRDVNHRYFMLVDTNLKTIRIATTDEGAFIEDDDDIKTPLGTKETYLVMLMISKYLENKNK